MQYNDLTSELSSNFIEYAASVNTDRAIPDAKSGLKPVAKRILYSAYLSKYFSNKPHVKSARIVGNVMGSWHPHGDSSIYGAMVRLSQNWVMRYPLIDWHGNNGNLAGDGPAAARYTEARLSKISEKGLLTNIQKKNVDFVLNYDETLEEPVTFPSAFPNLLCNPNSGIGVAMACNWAPNNLIDVANAIYAYMDGNELPIVAPDFPTGGLIINKDDLPGIMKTGHGTVKIRARYNIEDQKIIFYEIPYGQTIEGLLTELGTVCDEKEIEGITDAHDESNKKGVRIVITCAKGIDPNYIVKQIYNKTNFQTSFSYNQIALVNKTPTELNLYDCCKIYVDHTEDCLRKEINFDLEKAKARIEIVEGLLKALEDIDNIITLIKSSESSAKAKEALINKYNFTDNQAKAILAMRLSSLARLESIEIEKEKTDLVSKIENWTMILNNEKEQRKIVRSRLEEIVKEFGDARRTELTQIEIVKEQKEKKAIVPQDVVVVINDKEEIKRIPKSNFKIQHKNTKGIKNSEIITSSFSTNTLDTVMIFTSTGKMYKLPVDKIPEGTNTTKGVNINSFFTFDSDEKVQAVINLKETTNAEYVVFFTKQGLVKKTKLEEYKNLRKNIGTAAIKLKEGDSIASVTFLKDEEVIILTSKGMSVRVETDDITPISRLTFGRKAIKLVDDDFVLTGIPISRVEKNKYLVVGTKEGLVGKIGLDNFEVSGLNCKGKRVLKLAAADIIVNGMICDDADSLLITSNKHSKAVAVSELTVGSRDSTGRALVKDNEKIINMVKL